MHLPRNAIMSKYVKKLITDELKSRLDGVGDALLVDVIGMEANATVELRRELRQKNIQIAVVKNSLARRATEGTPLAPAFDGVEGSVAVVCWGAKTSSRSPKRSSVSPGTRSLSRSPPRAARWTAPPSRPTRSRP